MVMTNNAAFMLVIGAVVVGGIVAIALFNKTTSPAGEAEGEPPAPAAPAVDPNVPAWATAITGALSPLAQAGTSVYAAKTQADLTRARARAGMAGYQNQTPQRQNRVPRQPLAGYAHSITA